MRHRLHACNDSNCYVCRCDLQACEICGGAEGCLPKDCPGRSMTDEELKLVRRGVVNYVDGQWILLNNERYHKIRDVIAKNTCGSCSHFNDATGLETWCDLKDRECVEVGTPACESYAARKMARCARCGGSFQWVGIRGDVCDKCLNELRKNKKEGKR